MAICLDAWLGAGQGSGKGSEDLVSTKYYRLGLLCSAIRPSS